MVGIENYALKLGILYLPVPMPRKMEINTDVLMNCTPMRCGVQMISEECNQCGEKDKS